MNAIEHKKERKFLRKNKASKEKEDWHLKSGVKKWPLQAAYISTTMLTLLINLFAETGNPEYAQHNLHANVSCPYGERPQ